MRDRKQINTGRILSNFRYGNYQAAFDELLAVDTQSRADVWQQTKDQLVAAILARANEHCFHNQFQEAISLFQIIPVNIRNADCQHIIKKFTKGIVSTALYYLNQKQHKEAMFYLELLPAEFIDDAWNEVKVRYLFETHQIQDALDFLSKIKPTKNNLMAAARCHEVLRQYDKALEKYEFLINNYADEDFINIFGQARCQRAMRQYHIELAILNHVEMALTSLQVSRQICEKISQAVLRDKIRCYINMGDYEPAIRYLNLILERNPHDVSSLLELAHCYRLYGKFHPALKIFSDIGDQTSDSQDKLCASLGLAETYFDMGKLDAALSIYTSISCLNNNRMFLDLARCYQQNNPGLARHFYAIATELNPASEDAYYYCCAYLLEQKDKEFETSIMDALEKFPLSARLYLLQVRYLFQQDSEDAEINQKNEESAVEMLKILIKQYPWFGDAYLEMIRFSFEMGDYEVADFYVQYCYQYFPQHYQLLDRIIKISTHFHEQQSLAYAQQNQNSTLHHGVYTYQQISGMTAMQAIPAENADDMAQNAEQEQVVAKPPRISFFGKNDQQLRQQQYAALDLAAPCVVTQKRK